MCTPVNAVRRTIQIVASSAINGRVAAPLTRWEPRLPTTVSTATCRCSRQVQLFPRLLGGACILRSEIIGLRFTQGRSHLGRRPPLHGRSSQTWVSSEDGFCMCLTQSAGGSGDGPYLCYGYCNVGLAPAFLV